MVVRTAATRAKAALVFYDDRIFRDSNIYTKMDREAVCGRMFTSYRITPSPDDRSIETAAKVLTEFLEQNRQLYPNFSTKPLEVLKNKISQAQYLVINGRMVFLTRNDQEKDLASMEEMGVRMQRLEEQQRDLREQMKRHERKIISFERIREPVLAIGTSSKMIVKSGGRELFKEICEKFMKDGSRFADHRISKTIPIVSLGLGLILGTYRARKGQWVRAGGEVASGFLACVPGWGSVASVCLDVGIHTADSCLGKPEESTPRNQIELHLPDAYLGLGIDIEKTPIPTKELVDQSYEEQMQRLHSGELRQYEGLEIDEWDFMFLLTNAKDFIYQNRGW